MGLGPAPSVPVSDGEVEFGTYRGSCDSTALGLNHRFRLGRFVRWRHERKFQRFWAVDERIALYGSVVDAGPVGFASLWVFDRKEQALLADTATVLPPFVVRIDDSPTADPVAIARFMDSRVTLDNRGDTARVSGRMGTTKFTLGYETPAADPITAVRPVPADTDRENPRRVMITQLSASLSVTGWLNADGRRHRLADDAVGMFEYFHGLVNRTTEFQGAIASGHTADGTAVGFTVRGGPDGVGNVVWIDGVPQQLGRATVSTDGCRIETDDGELSVALDVEHTHQRMVSAGPISQYIEQPFGRWHGTVGDRSVEGLCGVGEHYQARW